MFRNRYLIFLILLVAGYGLFEYYRPKPIDWATTYVNTDKIPFGTEVLFALLPDVFENQQIESLRLPIYNHLHDSKLPTKSSYVFVCARFEIDKNDQRELLKYVSEGNTAFVSAYDISDSLLKKIGLSAEIKPPTLRDTSLGMNFVFKGFRRPKDYVFKHDDGRNYLRVLDSTNVTVLGQNARKEAVFVRVNFGKGLFLVHNLPLALTNYAVLDTNTADYAFKTLSYLPKNAPVYWDEYLKQGRFGENQTSPLRYILSQDPLRWAYYLALFGLMVFGIFGGKRTQRIIPVVEPLQNTTLDFVKTIGKMYFQKRDPGNMAQKKVQYFLAHIRQHFGLKTNDLGTAFRFSLAEKTGIPSATINQLFNTIAIADDAGRVSEFVLLQLNEQIENFYQQANQPNGI